MVKILRPIFKNKSKLPLLDLTKDKNNDPDFERMVNLVEYLDVDKENTFYAKVDDNTLIDSDIFPNDLLIADISRKPNNNSLVIAIVDNQYTVNHYSEINKKRSVLLSYKNYNPTLFSDNIKICGVVTNVIHSFI